MSKLNKNEQQLILDFYFRCGDTESIDEGRNLVAKNPEAASLYAQLEETLTGLDSIKYEPCPDNLVELTVQKLMLAAAGAEVTPAYQHDMHSHVEKLSQAAAGSQQQLESLIAKEQTRKLTIQPGFWRNFGGLLATAAVILLVAGVLFPSLRFLRLNSWQQLCQMQLSRIGRSMQTYSSDYNGSMPTVATTAGAPWWKVGYKPKSKENYSNTRHIWLLVKNGYVKPADFVCPGKRQGRVIQFDSAEVQKYNDFPARRYITFSLRLRPNKITNSGMKGLMIVMADLNPLFEALPDHTNALSLRLSPQLVKQNSINHNRRGQNVLFYDGSVAFRKDRVIDSGTYQDDMYTLKDTQVYKGFELPSSEADAFLAP